MPHMPREPYDVGNGAVGSESTCVLCGRHIRCTVPGWWEHVGTDGETLQGVALRMGGTTPHRAEPKPPHIHDESCLIDWDELAERRLDGD